MYVWVYDIMYDVILWISIRGTALEGARTSVIRRRLSSDHLPSRLVLLSYVFSDFYFFFIDFFSLFFFFLLNDCFARNKKKERATVRAPAHVCVCVCVRIV